MSGHEVPNYVQLCSIKGVGSTAAQAVSGLGEDAQYGGVVILSVLQGVRVDG